MPFKFGAQIVRFSWVFLLAWIVVVCWLVYSTPDFNSVVETGEFNFLPEDSPSRVSESLFEQSFSRDLLGSLIVIIVKRENRPSGLITDEELKSRDAEHKTSDFEFVENILKPELEKIVKEVVGEGLLKSPSSTEIENQQVDAEDNMLVRTYTDSTIGRLLNSEDRQATLVTIELPNDFLDARNGTLIERIENLIDDDTRFRSKIPYGLKLSLSGSAMVGRDMNEANIQSAHATELLTVILLVILLIWIYRAPLLVVLPILAIDASLKIAISLVILLANAKYMVAFTGMNIYMTVVTYGAGVDYCLFLISRYRELLNKGVPVDEALAEALDTVGAAIMASAGTSILGIGMMILADFGKFQEAGMGIAIGLMVATFATLTLLPPLLRIAGPYAFWPKIHFEKPLESPGWYKIFNIFPSGWTFFSLDNFWPRISEFVIRYPSRIWYASVAAMLPFAVLGVLWFDFLSYGLLSELSDDTRSVIGTKDVQEHFPAGTTGPTTVLLLNKSLDFSTDESKELIDVISVRLKQTERRTRSLRSKIVFSPFWCCTKINRDDENE